MFFAVVIQLVTTDVPCIRMAHTKVANNFLRKCQVARACTRLRRGTHHRTIWASIPLLAAGIPLQVRCTSCCSRSFIVHVLTSNIIETYAI